jgi:amidase
MPIQPATRGEVESIARELGLHFDAEDVAFFHGLLAPFGSTLLDLLPDELPPVRHPRTPGVRPPPEENPLGAWYVKTHIPGAAKGPLAGRSVALKDNVLLAGVPMMNGTTLLEGYVPPIDATVATRILDAGGTIAGKAVCESWCFSGGSHTSDTGPVRNPRDPSRSAGGSSSGSAALVAAGEVDMAIGCDQGGSIRVPASFCGVVGMKPTHGLVPYTGILSLEPTIDHAGPITRTVADNALLLQAIAGPDGLDPRQADVRTDDYVGAIGGGVEGLRVGVLREGFGQMDSEPDVDAGVRAAAERLGRLGAKVEEVSVPLHPMARALVFPILQSGAFLVFHADGCALGHEDLCVPSLVDRLRGWRERADQLPDTAKFLLLGTELLRRRHGFRYWAKAVNFVRRARAVYDAVLERVDLLVLPTTPMKAPPLPPPGASREAVIGAAFAPPTNTMIFDHTHHPALSAPCGESEGLPIGMMLVGRRWEEAALYRAAHALEQSPQGRGAAARRGSAERGAGPRPAGARASGVTSRSPRRSRSRPGRGKPGRRRSRSSGSRPS